MAEWDVGAVAGTASPHSPHLGVRREITQRAVLEALAAEGGPLSRAEIARRTSISAPTISQAVRRLEAEAILGPVGVRSGHAGAVATLYDLVPTAGVVLAAQLDATVIRTAASDVSGTVLAVDEEAIDRAPDDAAAQVDARLGAMAAQVAGDGRPVRAVAVSVAYPVDPTTGAPSAMRDVAGPDAVVRASDIHLDPETVVLLDNDVNLAALAEGDHGAAVGASSFVYVYVGSDAAVGLGLVIDGQVVDGAHGLGGEIGHLPVDGPPGSAAKSRLGVALAGLDLRARAGLPGGDAVGGLTAAGRLLGEVISVVCAVVDPGLVVLGGSVGTSPGLLGSVRATVGRLAPRDVPVVAGTVGVSAPLWGALARARRSAWQQLSSTR